MQAQKPLIAFSIFLMAGLVIAGSNSLADPTSEAIVKILVQKGIITQQEINEMKDVLKKSEDVDKGLNQGGDAFRKETAKPLNAYWDEKFWLATEDESFMLGFGGRMMADWAWIRENDGLKADVGLQDDDAEIREARMSFIGKMYQDYLFKFQFEFARGLELKDVYFERKNLPYIGTFRVGQFKEPIGLENNTSKRFITFMERSSLQDLLPERETGFMIYNTLDDWDDRAYYALGFFKDIGDDGDSDGDTDSGDYTFDVRVTGLPWYEDEGRQLVHIGGDYTFKSFNDDDFRFRARPESHIQSRFVNTGTIGDAAGEPDSKEMHRWVAEVAAVWGPASIQGEYALIDMRTRKFSAYYGYASVFLTGEHREYDKSLAEFTRVRPKRNFNWVDPIKNPGAWEAGLRYSRIDLSDGDVNGGEMDNITAGLNWYWNPNMRVMLNYIYSDLNRFSTIIGQDAHIIQTRFQLDY